ncbi:MAG: alkylglycerol monooxygenase [Saprospiraceae bacterium]|jgi:alkylglycerol monooxygenase
MPNQYLNQVNAFALSVVIMILLLLGEYVASLLLKKKVFNFSDTVTNAACGILERGIYLLFVFAYFGVFDYMFQFRIMTIPTTWWSFIILFFAVDFLWYVYHVGGHVINVLWAAHITHHQSEEFNFSLSFRVSSPQLLTRVFFWALLPLFGFDPLITTLVIGGNAAYQFFIHTQLIGKVGFLEHILITPSHHRVHHGKNPKYIDKNYGGILVIWDKMFGTFQKEEEEVKYGITKSLNSYNPLTAWFHYYADLYKASKTEKRVKNKLKIWFGGPELLEDYYNAVPDKKHQPNVLNTSLKWYLSLQFSILSVQSLLLFRWYGTLNENDMTVFIIYCISSAASYGVILENKSYSAYVEVIKIILASAMIVYMSVLFDNPLFLFLGPAYAVIFLSWLFQLKGRLLNY